MGVVKKVEDNSFNIKEAPGENEITIKTNDVKKYFDPTKGERPENTDRNILKIDAKVVVHVKVEKVMFARIVQLVKGFPKEKPGPSSQPPGKPGGDKQPSKKDSEKLFLFESYVVINDFIDKITVKSWIGESNEFYVVKDLTILIKIAKENPQEKLDLSKLQKGNWLIISIF